MKPSNSYLESAKKASYLFETLSLVEQEKITEEQSNVIIDEVYKTGKTPDEIIKEKKIPKADPKYDIDKIVKDFLDERKGNILYINGTVAGHVLKKTGGPIDPKQIELAIERALKK